MNSNTFEQVTENVQKSEEGPKKVDFEEMRQTGTVKKQRLKRRRLNLKD